MKMCSKCNISKSVDEFYKVHGKPVAACKECTKLATSAYIRKTGKYKGTYGTSKFVHLFGQTVNDWTIIGTEITKSQSPRVLCRCKCGYEKFVICSRLQEGTPKGCSKCHPRHGSHSPIFKGVGEFSISHYKKILANAEVRNIAMEVDIKYMWNLYMEQNGKCKLTGLDIHFGKHVIGVGTKMQTKTASLDRIDSSKGYVEGNLQWIHKNVNRMKNIFTNEYFIDVCKRVSAHANGR